MNQSIRLLLCSCIAPVWIGCASNNFVGSTTNQKAAGAATGSSTPSTPTTGSPGNTHTGDGPHDGPEVTTGSGTIPSLPPNNGILGGTSGNTGGVIGGDVGGSTTGQDISIDDGTVIGTRVSKFYIGGEDRPNDPDAYPYHDFFVCFQGKFAIDGPAAPAINRTVKSVMKQTVTFTLHKASGCSGYTYTIKVSDKNGAQKAPISTVLNGVDALAPVSVDLEVGDVIGGLLDITGKGGGCQRNQYTLGASNWLSTVGENEFGNYPVTATCN